MWIYFLVLAISILKLFGLLEKLTRLKRYNAQYIVNKREWLWSPAHFFVICFCFCYRFWPSPCTSHNRFGKMLEQLTNKNIPVKLFNYKSQRKRKDCAGLWLFQHEVQQLCYQLWSSPTFMPCFLLLTMLRCNKNRAFNQTASLFAILGVCHFMIAETTDGMRKSLPRMQEEWVSHDYLDGLLIYVGGTRRFSHQQACSWFLHVRHPRTPRALDVEMAVQPRRLRFRETGSVVENSSWIQCFAMFHYQWVHRSSVRSYI